MTIINNSLAYSGETLIYNNECELLWPDYIDPYNPLNLPANTVRVRTNDGAVPRKRSSTSYDTATLVSGTSDVYDVYKSGTDFSNLFYDSINVVEVLGANTTGITKMMSMFSFCSSLTTVHLFDTSSVINMREMFYRCSSLASVPIFNTSIVVDMQYMFKSCTSLTSAPLFDTSSVTNMYYMFDSCTSLTSVPLFDTSSVTSMGRMFYNCSSLTTVPLFNTSNVGNMVSMLENCASLTSVPLFNTSSAVFIDNMLSGCINVETGALALYQQLSTQATPPSNHSRAFKNCGSNTTTGAAELAQIPDDWK